jgi:predicted nucleotidyltransferase
MGLPVQELMAQIDLHIPIETTSAQMKADEIGESIFTSLFKTKSIRGLCFVDQDHDEMMFQNSWMRNRPAGIAFFRVRGTVDPREIHAYIKEPVLTAKFDLALAQTNLVTPFSA